MSAVSAESALSGELPGFQDYTVATAWEKFVANLEHCLHVWSPHGPGRQALLAAQQGSRRLDAHLYHRLPFRSDGYILSLLLPEDSLWLGGGRGSGGSGSSGRGTGTHEQQAQQQRGPASSQGSGGAAGGSKGAAGAGTLAAPGALRDRPHKLQEWFAAGPCLLLAPDSYSGRVLDSQEAHTLLSAGALALAQQRLGWPLLVPVQDAVRDAYQGVAVGRGGAEVRLECDSLHTSRLPARLLQMEHQLQLFMDRLLPVSPAAAAACLRAPASSPTSSSSGRGSSTAGDGPRGAPLARRGIAGATTSPHVLQLAVRTRKCFEVFGSRSQDVEDDLLAEGDAAPDWDVEAPWRPWAAEQDPLGCLELDVVTSFDTAAEALACEQCLSGAEVRLARCPGCGFDSCSGNGVGCSCEWSLVALRQGYERDTGQRGFVLRVTERRRQFLRLQSILPVSASNGQQAQQPLHQPTHTQRDGGPGTDHSQAADAVMGAPESNGDTSHLGDKGIHAADGIQSPDPLEGWEHVGPELLPGAGAFHGMLSTLLDSCRHAERAHAVGQLASEAWWLQQGAYMPTIPAEWVLQDMIRDVLQAPGLPAWPGPRLWGLDATKDVAAMDGQEHQQQQQPEQRQEQQQGQQQLGQGSCGAPVIGKAAPLWSLITRFALHCLVMGSPRATALLWGRLVRELRFAHWDTLTPLPRMDPPQQPGAPQQQQHPATQEAAGQPSGGGSGGVGQRSGAVDHRLSLVCQKLQLLQLCILAARQQQQQQGQQGQHKPGTGSTAGAPIDGPAVAAAVNAGVPAPGKGDEGAAASNSRSDWGDWESWGDSSASTTPTAAAAAAAGATMAPTNSTSASQPASSAAAAAAAAAAAKDSDAVSEAGSEASSSYHSAAEDQSASGGASASLKGLAASEPLGDHALQGGSRSGDAGPSSDAPQLAEAKAEQQASRTSGLQWGAPPAVDDSRRETALLGTAEGAWLDAESLATALPTREQQQQQHGLTEPAAAEQGLSQDSKSLAGSGETPAAPGSGVGREGVAGFLPGPGLHDCPSRQLAIPMTQVAPPCTEDVCLERHLAMKAMRLLDDSAADIPRLRSSRAQGPLLASDMSAFKPANPGAVLEDFVRWRRYSQAQQRQLQDGDVGDGSLTKLCEPGGPWQQLWASVPAVPAARQRPLFDPVLEGERALHFLETLPPALLFGELLAVGFSAAVGLLGKAEAAGLPAVAAELQRLQLVADTHLQHGVLAGPSPSDALQPSQTPSSGGANNNNSKEAASPATTTGAASKRHAEGSLPPPLRQLYQSALSVERFGALLRMLGCVEQSVAAGESLLLRLSTPLSSLPDDASNSSRHSERQHKKQISSCSDGTNAGASLARLAADDLVASALGQQTSQAAYPGRSSFLGGTDSLVPNLQQQQEQQQQQQDSQTYGTVWAVPSREELRDSLRQLVKPAAAAGAGLLGLEQGSEVIPSDEEEAYSDAVGGNGGDREGEERGSTPSEGASASGRSSGGASAASRVMAPVWPRPFLKEWLYELGSGQQPAISPVVEGMGTAVQGGGAAAVKHRLYVRALPAELRVATVMTCGARTEG